MRYPIDASEGSAVVRCPSCGSRWLVLDRLQALRAARAHERSAHPGEVFARDALNSALYRQRRRG